MRYLRQIQELKEISEYKRKCKESKSRATYEDMPKKELRRTLVMNQGGICAYCMSRIHCDERRISENGYIHIEHIIPENAPVVKKGKDSNTDVKNMLGVCAGNRDDNDEKNKHCDASRGGRLISISPYDKKQMETIGFLVDGTIRSSDVSLDKELNDILNLNSKRNSLKRNRQIAYKKLRDKVTIMCKGETINRSQLEKLRQMFCSPDSKGMYIEYVGVYEYWLNKWGKKA